MATHKLIILTQIRLPAQIQCHMYLNVTFILLSVAKQKIVRKDFLLIKWLFEIGPRPPISEAIYQKVLLSFFCFFCFKQNRKVNQS